MFINADDSKEKPSTKPSKRNLVLEAWDGNLNFETSTDFLCVSLIYQMRVQAYANFG